MTAWSIKKHFKNSQILLDSIGDGIIIVDKKGVIFKVNKVFHEIMGYTQKEVEGKDSLVLLGATNEKGDPIDKRNAALFKSIKEGKKITNAIRQFSRKNGEHFWVSITTTSIKSKNGKVEGGLIVLRDITETKAQEEYHTEFAHIASHSLRMPLANILWGVEHLLSGQMGKLNKKQKEFAESIYAMLRQMNSIISDLLSIANLKNKKVKPNREKVYLKDLTCSVIDQLSLYSKARNLKIDFKTKGNSNFVITADERHVRTIIQNIIENAIRYSFDGATINVVLEKKKGKTLFSCKNKGIGIPEGNKRFVFAKFFRAKNAVDKEGDGTGLGMYTTHELVKMNKGMIWFDSEENKETTFFVSF